MRCILKSVTTQLRVRLLRGVELTKIPYAGKQRRKFLWNVHYEIHDKKIFRGIIITSNYIYTYQSYNDNGNIIVPRGRIFPSFNVQTASELR